MPAAVPMTSARDRIVDAAIELFATRGYQAIGLRDLAGHLGLQAGSLYHHIENKQALLFEIIESALSDLLADTQRKVKRSRTSGEGLVGFVQTFVAFNMSDRNRLALVTRESVNLCNEHRQQILALEQAYVKLLSQLISQQCGADLPRQADLNLLTHAVLGMLYGHAQWQDLNVPQQQLSQALSQLVLRMISNFTLQ